jgi:hypothetical protein
MLLFSPLWLFAIPGVLSTAVGLFLTLAVAFTRMEIFGHRLQTHFALLGSALSILGVQVVLLGMFAKTIYVLDGIGDDRLTERLIARFRLEWALLAGLLAVSSGLAVDGHILYVWLKTHGGTLTATDTHLAIVAGTLLAIGVEIIFSAFFLSILRASRTRKWT